MHAHSPFGPFLSGSNAVKPVIGSYEVSSWVSHNRNVQLFHRFNNVFTKAIFIREGVLGVVDSAVDASAHVSGVKVSFVTVVSATTKSLTQ